MRRAGETVRHSDVRTNSLGASDARIAEAKRHATSLIREQHKHREKQAYAQEFGADDEIVRELTPAGKAAILQRPPTPPGGGGGKSDPHFLAELELYNRVARG